MTAPEQRKRPEPEQRKRPEPEQRKRPEWEPIGGVDYLWEDYGRESFPRRTEVTGARNGMPESGGYVYDPRGRARELEIAAHLEALREQVRQHMEAEPMRFTDPVSELRCELVTTPGVGIRHPGCDRLADLAAHLDAFYCPQCGINGRISGAWAMDMVRNRAISKTQLPALTTVINTCNDPIPHVS